MSRSNAMRLYMGKSGAGIRRKLTSQGWEHIYAIDSEVSPITYVYHEGEFAICNGRFSVRLRPDVAKELREILDDVIGGMS